MNHRQAGLLIFDNYRLTRRACLRTARQTIAQQFGGEVFEFSTISKGAKFELAHEIIG